MMAGFDDGSVVLWECRQPTAELTSLKLFSEPGTGVYNPHVPACLILWCILIVMCLAFDAKQLSGICGSPTNSLEAFALSKEEVRPTSRAMCTFVQCFFCFDQCVLEKRYSVELKNAGVADVSVRQDSKIIASGGWDGRLLLTWI